MVRRTTVLEYFIFLIYACEKSIPEDSLSTLEIKLAEMGYRLYSTYNQFKRRTFLEYYYVC